MARRSVVAAALVGALGLAACSGNSFVPSTTQAVIPSGKPGNGRPPVTLGDENFTEEFILGQLYTQALRAKGYRVRLMSNIGSSGAVDGALLGGQIDLYPEYAGVIVSELEDIDLAAPGGAPVPVKTPPDSARQAYEQAAAFEDSRGLALLNPTPFQKAVATTPGFTRTDQLRSTRYQDVAPVVSKHVLTREGPAFAQTLNALSAKLTTEAMQGMDAAVNDGHRNPADVARTFLTANGFK